MLHVHMRERSYERIRDPSQRPAQPREYGKPSPSENEPRSGNEPRRHVRERAGNATWLSCARCWRMPEAAKAWARLRAAFGDASCGCLLKNAAWPSLLHSFVRFLPLQDLQLCVGDRLSLPRLRPPPRGRSRTAGRDARARTPELGDDRDPNSDSDEKRGVVRGSGAVWCWPTAKFLHWKPRRREPHTLQRRQPSTTPYLKVTRAGSFPGHDAQAEHVRVLPQGPLGPPAPRGSRVEPRGARAGQNRAPRAAQAVPGGEAL